MTEQSSRLNVKDIRTSYPDCPQREIALGLLREGNEALAQAWIDKLDELMQRGKSGRPDLDSKVG